MHRTACKLFAAKINKTKVSRRLNTMSDLFYYATLTTTMINITSSPAQQGRGSITGGRYSTLATAAARTGEKGFKPAAGLGNKLWLKRNSLCSDI